MRTSTELLAREGWLPTGIAAVFFLLTLWFSLGDLLTLIAFLMVIASATFFRNPERLAEEESPQVILAPLDGRIRTIEAEGEKTRIVIGNRFFDTRFLRAPSEGKMETVTYRRGLFLSLASPLAQSLNESFSTTFSVQKGKKITLRHTGSGCPLPSDSYKKEGETLHGGERIGILPSGESTLILPSGESTLILPKGADVRTAVGDRIIAGETILAYLR